MFVLNKKTKKNTIIEVRMTVNLDLPYDEKNLNTEQLKYLKQLKSMRTV